MYKTLINISADSIFLPLIILLFRYKSIHHKTLPIFVLIVLGAITEIVVNVMVANIFILLEAILIFKQLEIWLDSYRSKRFIKWLYFITSAIWAFEFFIFNPNADFLYITIYISNFFIVLLSIKKLNELTINDSKKFDQSPEFIFCFGFILFFSFVMLTHSFYTQYLHTSKSFKRNIWLILIIVNFITNIIYTYGILKLPAKQKTRYLPIHVT